MHIRVQIGGTYAIDLDAYVVRREFEGERLYRRDPDDATRYRLVLKMNDTTAANDRTDGRAASARHRPEDESGRIDRQWPIASSPTRDERLTRRRVERRHASEQKRKNIHVP